MSNIFIPLCCFHLLTTVKLVMFSLIFVYIRNISGLTIVINRWTFTVHFRTFKQNFKLNYVKDMKWTKSEVMNGDCFFLLQYLNFALVLHLGALLLHASQFQSFFSMSCR